MYDSDNKLTSDVITEPGFNNFSRYLFKINGYRVVFITKVYDDDKAKYFLNFGLNYLHTSKDFFKIIKQIEKENDRGYEMMYKAARSDDGGSFLK